MWDIEINYTNEYGENQTIRRKVEAGWCEMDEIEFLHDTYKQFLNAISYPIYDEDEIVVLRENEYVETYCDEDDCDCCELNNEENQPCQWRE